MQFITSKISLHFSSYFLRSTTEQVECSYGGASARLYADKLPLPPLVHPREFNNNCVTVESGVRDHSITGLVAVASGLVLYHPLCLISVWGIKRNGTVRKVRTR